MQDDKKLVVNQKALDYVADIYRFSTCLPKDEKYNLVSQIRRASVSVPLNISEGAASNTKKEFAQCLSYAYRSVKEVLTCLELVENLNLIKHSANKLQSLKNQGEELCKMIYSFRQKLIVKD